MADDLGIGAIGRQAADSARHEIKHATTLGEQIAIAGGKCLNRATVDMRDEPQRRAEGEIAAAVLLGERAGR